MLKNKKWIYKPQNGEQYFFMHIPKTGGTTFRLLLNQHFSSRHLYPNRMHLMMNGEKYLRQKELIENRKDILEKPLISGHYNIHLLKHLMPGVKVITFVRNPMDRIISHIKHILKKNPAYKDADPNEVVKDKVDLIVNLQAKILGFNFKTKSNIEKALENVNKIDCIGVLEHFNDSIDLINKKLNWNLEYNNEVSNKMEMEVKTLLNEESMNLINEQIHFDIQIYKACLAKFEKDYKIYR